MIPLGVRVYALGALALGAVGLYFGDFALVWQPVPATLPGRIALAYLFAALLTAGAVAALVPSRAAAGSALLGILFSVVVLCMHVPHAVLHPAALASWSGIAEQLVLALAGFIGWALLAPGTVPRRATYLRAGQLLFAACLVLFGIVHFRYLAETAAMVPAWLPPGQRFWAVATGIAHIAAGLALASGVLARAALIALTVMFALFGVLVHAPLLVADAHSHLNWSMNAVNLALTGAAWVVADSLACSPAKR